MYKLVKGLGLVKIAENDTIEPKPNTKIRSNVKRTSKPKLPKDKVETDIPAGTSEG